MKLKKYLVFLFLCLYLNGVMADVKGVWGNIVKIDDFGSVSQRSMTGFRVENSSPYTIEYLGSSNNSVKFNDIPDNFSTEAESEYTFDNRFNLIRV